MELHIKSFFVTFTSRCIQRADCSKWEDCLNKARALVNEQEDELDSFLKTFIKEWDIDDKGLTLITKPIRHELFYDPDHEIQYEQWPYNKRNIKYEAGSAIIHIPLLGLNPRIAFENDDFVHGHLTNNLVNCWGHYKDIGSTVLHGGGPVAALTAIYGFCKFSRYGTHLKSRPQEPSNV